MTSSSKQKIEKRAPIAYSGSGSAIDNYFSAEPQKNENWGLFDKNNNQHRTVMSHLYTAQWTVQNEAGREIPDLLRFSDWLKSEKSPVRKPLMDMTSKEISKIIVALGGIIEHKFK